MLRRATLGRTDVIEELSASFIRVTRIGEVGTTLAVTNNQRTLRRSCQISCISSGRKVGFPFSKCGLLRMGRGGRTNILAVRSLLLWMVETVSAILFLRGCGHRICLINLLPSSEECEERRENLKSCILSEQFCSSTLDNATFKTILILMLLFIYFFNFNFFLIRKGWSW
jgi:hypothetical protein